MKADTDAAIEAFGKNEHVKKVLRTLFVAMAGLVLARVVDPGGRRSRLSGLLRGWAYNLVTEPDFPSFLSGIVMGLCFFSLLRKPAIGSTRRIEFFRKII
jgi:hypothetical protein